MKRFSDFANSAKATTGDKIKIEDVLGKEIKVTGYTIGDSKLKLGTKLLTLEFELEGKQRILFTGSSVLIKQIEEHGHEIPFLTKIQKVNRFYTFT